MLTRILFSLLLAMPSVSFGDASVEKFFQSLEGKWHGEEPGIYVVDIKVTAFDSAKPWSLQTGTIEIVEGKASSYDFELSKNKSQLDNEEIYFLKITRLGETESQIYTLGNRAKASSPLSFWQHMTGTIDGVPYTSANAVKIFTKDANLTWGFVTGSGYCKENQGSSLCVTDGYTPYHLQRVGLSKGK